MNGEVAGTCKDRMVEAPSPTVAPKFESRWTELNVDQRSMQIHARVADAVCQPGLSSVVFVHGLLVSSRYMLPTAQAVARHRTVHVPDLPGYGKSDKPPRALDVRGLAGALAEYVQVTGLERPAIVANSFGCQIAAEFAARHPDRLSCLTLLGPTVDPSSRPALKLALRWAMNIPLEPFSLDLVLLRDLLDMGIPRMYETLRHMMRHHIETLLPSVSAPTLVVRGGRDSTVSQRWAEHFVSLLPDGRLAVIPGAPHTLNYNSPDHVVRLLETFWREVPARV